MLRAGRMPVACAILAIGLAGCGHKQAKVHIPVTSPVDLEALAAATEGDIDPIPQPELAPLPWPEPARPPVRRRVPPHDDASGSPQPGNDTPGPAELAIGALTSGGDATPQSQQQARDLIASVDRRITGLPAKVADAQKPQLRQVRKFLDQAKQALNSGDTDGATNLATKAKVLMDELESR
jgi:hypothetical protein